MTIDYTLVPLAGPSEYEYRYTVTNDALAPSLSWFTIDFDPALYDENSLLISSVGKADWSEQLFVSSPLLGLPAQYDAYKTSGTPLAVGQSESGFAVRFTWLGSGTPGAQAFTVYDPDTLNVLDTGRTSTDVTPPPPHGVPEPGGLALTLLALAGVAAVARRGRNLPPARSLPAGA